MKPGVFTQLYVQLIFAVKHREALLNPTIQPRVFEYLSGIAKDLKHKSIIVNGVEDHVHIFLGLNPSISISDTVHDLKQGASLFINRNNLMPYNFSWQEGYGAFSYSKSQIKQVYQYISNQEKHHHKTTFREEYIEFLKKFEIDYDPKFLFDFFEK